jgi:lysophospholipid acyltransferase (LPLAT)-like uncharacterized protein
MKQVARWAAGRFGPGAMRWLARSWRIELVHPERWQALRASGVPYVLLSWHEALLPVLWQHRELGIAAVVSEARDGQYLATLARVLGYRVIGGSSTRGAHRALRGAIRTLAGGVPVGLTPDGPRGPRRVVKPGVVAAAERGGALILPVHAESRPAWRAGSWDRFLVPPPFARVRLAYGEPFEAMAGGHNRDQATARVARELEAATRLAAWPDGAAILTG